MGFGYGQGFRDTQGIVGRAPKGEKPRVLNDGAVIRAWADQDRPMARNSRGNIYFKGRTIYSYRDSWPLATITDLIAKDGRPIMVHNVEKYDGHVTNMHSRSIPHYDKWFVVEVEGFDVHTLQAEPYTFLRLVLEEKFNKLKERADDLCNVRKSFSRWTGGAYVAMSCEERYTEIVTRRRELIQLAHNLGVEVPEFGLGEALVKLQHAFLKHEAGAEKRNKAALARIKRECIRNIKNYLNRENGRRWWHSTPLGRDPEKLEAWMVVACQHRMEDIKPVLHVLQKLLLKYEHDELCELTNPEMLPSWGRYKPLADQLELERWRNTMYDREALYPLPVVIQS